MDWLPIALVVLVLFVLQGAFFWFVLRKRESKEDMGGMTLLQRQMENLERSLDSRMSESSRQIHESMRTQMGESNRIVQDVTVRLAELGETNRQVISFADQLKSLQDILKNPKQRGVLGEYFLETVLKNVLSPGLYKMQYPFKNGEIVDAVVFVNDKIVPIDSKFSLENYNRLATCLPEERAGLEKAFVADLKMRIQETAKYVRPEEGTMEFAFMFIPSEGIYYDLLVNSIAGEEDLIGHAMRKYKVIIVSPSSFHAYLQTVLQGLKALQIEQKAAEIQKRVGELGKHVGAWETYYKKLGTALSTAVSHWNSGQKELGKIDKDVYRIAESKIGIEAATLDKPSVQDDD